MRRSTTILRYPPLLFIKTVLFCLALILFNSSSSAQTRIDSLLQKIDPQKWSASVSKKANKLQEKIIAKSEKILQKLQAQEEKVYEKMLHSKDSLAAKAQLERIRMQYASLHEKLKTNPITSATNVKDYIPHLDTLQSAFKFLDNRGLPGNVKDALSKVESLNGRFQQAAEIRNFIRERREALKQQLTNLGMLKELKQVNKEVFYYAEQINEYKAIINDPTKREKKAIELLSKTKLFKDFVRKNSMLASLFRLPGGDPNDPAYQTGMAGLQTRMQVNNAVLQQIGSGPNSAQQFQQSIASAQAEFSQVKNKMMSLGKGSNDDIMPEGFKPNNEKKKSFLKRLEYGTTLQTQRASNYFPTTSDLGLSVGYKLNNKSVIGIAATYKIGWGHGWRNFNVSSQGVGLRSFIEWKMKGNFYLTGGYEQNYRTAFSDFDQLKDRSAWQESGLIGITKLTSFGKKLIKKTKLQLLWDILSYQQIPRTQPIVFRIGYTIK